MKRIVVTLYRKREKMKKKSLKAVGTVLAVCLCATACGSTASTTIEDNTANSETKEASTEPASVVQSQETAEVSQDAKETSVDNFTVTYLDDGTVMLSDYRGDEESIIVPGEVNAKSVTVIESNTFANHAELRSVILPDSLIEIKSNAFINCDNITNVQFGNSLEIIGNGAFSSTKIESINFPESIKEIGDVAFCWNPIKELNIPHNLEVVHASTFSCLDIEFLDVPGNIKNIEDEGFSGCKLLQEVIMEDGVEVIGESAFEGCDVLEKVTLASTVTEIGPYAFTECPELTYVYISEATTTIDEDAFWNSENVTIYTPAGSYAESFAIENNIPYVNQ